MARVTHVFTLAHVATMIGESPELIEIVCWNSDNIPYDELISVIDGTDENITTLSRDGVESLQELLADIRTWDGGIRQFLINEQCDPDVIDRIMRSEEKS